MDLDVRQQTKTLEQGFRSGSEVWNRIGVILVMFAVVSGKNLRFRILRELLEHAVVADLQYLAKTAYDRFRRSHGMDQADPEFAANLGGAKGVFNRGIIHDNNATLA